MLGNKFIYPETDEKATTIRSSQYAFLHIDSQDRYPLTKDGVYKGFPTNPNSLYINNQKISGAGQIKRIGVTEIDFPWTTPNVNERNNKLYLGLANVDIANSNVYVEVTEDWYRPSELSNILTYNLNNNLKQYPSGTLTTIAGNTWTVFNNSKNSVFTIFNSNANVSFNLSAHETISQDLTTLMGYEDLIGAPYGNFVTSGIPTMAYTRYIDVCSSTLTKFQNLKDSLTQYNYNDILCRIYLDNPINTPVSDTGFFGSRPCINLYRQFESPKYIEWNNNEMITSLDIKLYDDAGQLLYIPKINWDNNYFLTLHLSET